MARMNVALLGLALFATLAVCNAEKKQATEPFCTKASDVKEFTVYPDYEVEVSGVKGTLDFKIAFVDKESKEPISPWHDIPYGLEETDEGAFIWVVNEIPRGDLAKMETMTKREYNPIQQDDETVVDADGEELYDRPRYYGYGPSLVNYGSIPQTWEHAAETDNITKEIGDGDPLDSCDIGEAVAGMGLVYRVKVLGALPLMDSAETDWKIIVINENDPLAKKYNDISDVPEEETEAIYKWFRDYKTAAGKGQLEYFPTDGEAKDHWYSAEQAIEIIKAKNASWESLTKGECGEDCEKIWIPEA